jgi:hypothetical protein
VWNWVPYSVEVTWSDAHTNGAGGKGYLKWGFDVYSLTENFRVVGSTRLRWDGRRQVWENFERYELYGYGKLIPEPMLCFIVSLFLAQQSPIRLGSPH